jgi:hypothetical protein
MGEERNACSILIGKPGGKRPIGIPMLRWKICVKIDLRETGLEGVDWIHLAQDRDKWQVLMNTVVNLRFP